LSFQFVSRLRFVNNTKKAKKKQRR